MGKLDKIMTIVIILMFVSFGVSSLLLASKNKALRVEINKKEVQITELSEAFISLSKSFHELEKRKTYSISLSPNINNKVNSAFGNTKNVSLQYYFSMDGAKIELEADSVYQVTKIE